MADTLVQQAISGVLPRATLFTRYTRDSEEVSFGGSSFTPQERFEYYFRLQQPLLEGRLLPALDLAAATRRIERLRLREARDRLLFAVAAEFYGVLALEHDLAALELAHRHAAEQLRVLEVQERAGEAPRQQVLLMQARRDQVQAELHRTAQERLAARARLERLLGIELGERALADTYEVRSVPGALPELLEQGYAERPDLQAAAAAIEEAKARERLVWAEYLPKISLEWTHWTHMEGGFNAQIDWTLGVLGEWTLFDGGGREARLAQARSEVRQRELELAARRKQVRQEISEALYGLLALEMSLQALESRLEAARASLELAQARLRSGEATALDVLLAQLEHEEAERELGRSRLAHKLAALRIRLAVGDMKRAEPLLELLRSTS